MGKKFTFTENENFLDCLDYLFIDRNDNEVEGSCIGIGEKCGVVDGDRLRMLLEKKY